MTAFSDWLQNHAFSSTELEHFLLCPFRFYAECYLGLKPPAPFAIELSPPEIGKILHKVLERFFCEGSKRDILILLREELKSVVKEKTHLSSALLEIQQYKMERALTSFVEDLKHEQTLLMDLKPRYFEWSFGPETRPLSLMTPKGRKVHFKGRIDRIDINPIKKEFLIYDYKTGSKKITGSQILEGVSFQLPLYLMAVQEFLPDYAPIGAVYFSLADMSKKDGLLQTERLPEFLDIHPRSSSLIPAEQWPRTMKSLQNLLGVTVDQIYERTTEFESRLQPDGEPCEGYCPFQDVCRIRSS